MIGCPRVAGEFSIVLQTQESLTNFAIRRTRAKAVEPMALGFEVAHRP